MSFSFNFSGEDIEDSLDQDNDGIVNAGGDGGATADEQGEVEAFAEVEVRQWDLKELLATLPDRISYSTIKITSPTGKELHLPRRELFDVRVQLMAEDDPSNESTLADLSSTDIRTDVYEGGFKTWECSVDLSSLLLDRGPRKDIDEIGRCDQVVELGCGSALPTLTLFQHCLQNNISQSFTLADYNSSVLSLITLPNLLLTWAMYPPPNTSSNTPSTSSSLPTPILDPKIQNQDLEITPHLLSSFLSSLQTANITLTFLSGPWSPTLATLIPPSSPEMGTLVLAAETIYSPKATASFVQLLIQVLRRVKMAKAVIAAKRIYFGVGGGVDLFKEECAVRGAVAAEVENSGVEGMEGGGVGRALVEVQMF